MNFVDQFNSALDQLADEAKANGLTLTSICRQTGVSRATPDRWRKTTPKTILLLGEMQGIVEDAKKKRAEGVPPSEQFKGDL